MEEGVTNELLSGPMRDVFDTKQFITGEQSGNSGSGNNWARGCHHYGRGLHSSTFQLNLSRF
jgi:tubulin epsilon